MFVYFPPYSVSAVTYKYKELPQITISWYGHLTDSLEPRLEPYVGINKTQVTRIDLSQWSDKLRKHFTDRPCTLTYWQDDPQFVINWVINLPENADQSNEESSITVGDPSIGEVPLVNEGDSNLDTVELEDSTVSEDTNQSNEYCRREDSLHSLEFDELKRICNSHKMRISASITDKSILINKLITYYKNNPSSKE